MKNTSELTSLIDAIIDEFDFPKTLVYNILEDFDFLKMKNEDVDTLIAVFQEDEEKAMDIFSDLYTNRHKLKEAKAKILELKGKKITSDLFKDFLSNPELETVRNLLGV